VWSVEKYMESGKQLCLLAAFTLVSCSVCSVYFSTLKMEATCFSEMSVDFQRTTRCYIPEDRTLREKSSSSSGRTELVSSFRPQTPRHLAIFFLVFPLVDNIKAAWELCLMACSVHVAASFSSVRVSVYPTSSSPVVTLFRRPFPCPTKNNLMHTIETVSLLLLIVFHLFSQRSMFTAIHHARECHGIFPFFQFFLLFDAYIEIFKICYLYLFEHLVLIFRTPDI
jgi:hypothetical protein